MVENTRVDHNEVGNDTKSVTRDAKLENAVRESKY
jgi:hypothetical protein